jgi:hypothetical protein
MTTTTLTEYQTLCSAVEHALANFLGTDDFDTDIVDLVAMRIDEHLQKITESAAWAGYFDDILASTSTFVQADMDEDTLNDYVGELVEQLEEYGVV